MAIKTLNGSIAGKGFIPIDNWGLVMESNLKYITKYKNYPYK